MNSKSLDPAKAHLAAQWEFPETLYALALDPYRPVCYAGGSDHAIHVLERTESGFREIAAWRRHGNYVSALGLMHAHRPGLVLISAGYDRRLVWTTSWNGGLLREVEAHNGWIRDLKVWPDSSRFVTVADDMQIKVWDAETGENVLALEGHAPLTPQGYLSAIYAAAIAPDGSVFATADRVGDVRVWDAIRGKQLQQFQAPRFYTYDPSKRVRSIGGVRAIRFSPDGKQLALSGIGQVTNVDGFVGPLRVELWDWQQGQPVFQAEDPHNAVLNDVCFHPSQPWLAAAGGGDGGGLIALWDLEKKSLLHKIKLKGHVQEFGFSEEGGAILASGHGGVQAWNLWEAKMPEAKS